MTAAFHQSNYSWDFLKTFRIDSVETLHHWQSVEGLIEKAEDAIKPHIYEYKDWEERWERRLGPFCGGLTNINWSNFRPLRLSREEDWSDWLAWLLETSQTGFLADSLFTEQLKCQIATLISPKVKREDPVEGRRADIVISWKGATRMTHVEVKLWDENFDKTFETAQKLHAKEPDSSWSDFILIPTRSQALWNEVAQKHSKDENANVTVILWEYVARGLRLCLWNERESPFWRAWAWAFTCAIEIHLLGLEKLVSCITHSFG